MSTDDAVERAAPSVLPGGIEGASIQEIRNFAPFLNEALYIQALQSVCDLVKLSMFAF